MSKQDTPPLKKVEHLKRLLEWLVGWFIMSKQDTPPLKKVEHSKRLLEWLVGFIVFALLISGGGGCFFLPDKVASQDVARLLVQTAIITIATILPFGMYYHFVQTRHNIIKKEFNINLERLGMWPKDFEERFDAVYGGATRLSRAKSPVILATVILFIGWWMVFYPPSTPPVDTEQGQSAQIALLAQNDPAQPPGSIVEPNLTPLAFGFLGVYTMIIGSLVRRYFTSDLKPKAFITVIWEVLLVWSVVWTFSQVQGSFNFEGTVAPAVYFFLGTSPEVGVFLIQWLGATSLKISLLSRDEYPLTHIQGLNTWNRKRLREEGIENIQHLATADIVDLFLKTRFSAERIIDWVDQAILLFHIKPEKKDKGQSSPPSSGPALGKAPQPADAAAAPADSQTPDSPPALEKQTPDSLPLELAERAEAVRARYAIATGLDLANPIKLFLKAHIRNATDLLDVWNHTELGDPKLKALAQLINPTFGLEFLIETLRYDPNIVHIRAWRENGSLVTEETPEKVLIRANEKLDEAKGLWDKGPLRRKQAHKLYKRTAEIFSDVMVGHRGRPVFVNALMGRARANVKLGKLQDALNDYQKVIEFDIDGNWAMDARLERGRLMLEHQDKGEKLRIDGSVYDDLQSLLENEKYQTVENYLLFYELLKGTTIDFTAIRVVLTKALEKATDDATRVKVLLLRAEHTGKPDYLNALELDRDNPEIHKQLGESYLQVEGFDEAVKVYKPWVEQLDNSSEWKGFAYYKLGEAYRAQKKYDEAIDAYEKSRRMPIDVTIFQGVEAIEPLAECYEACKKYEKLVDLFKGTSNRLGLARAFRKAGEFEQAQEQLRIVHASKVREGADWFHKDTEAYQFELAMVKACIEEYEPAATRELITALLQRALLDTFPLVDRAEQELKSNEAATAWVNKCKAKFQGVEDALEKGARLLQDQEFARAFVSFTQAAETFVSGCPSAIQDNYTRIPPQEWTGGFYKRAEIPQRDRAQGYYERLIETKTKESVDLWTLYGLARAKANIDHIRSHVGGVFNDNRVDLVPIDDFTLEITTRLGTEERTGAHSYSVLRCTLAATEMQGFAVVDWRVYWPGLTLELQEKATWKDDNTPQTADQLADALQRFNSRVPWSHTTQ